MLAGPVVEMATAGALYAEASGSRFTLAGSRAPRTPRPLPCAHSRPRHRRNLLLGGRRHAVQFGHSWILGGELVHPLFQLHEESEILKALCGILMASGVAVATLGERSTGSFVAVVSALLGAILLPITGMLADVTGWLSAGTASQISPGCILSSSPPESAAIASRQHRRPAMENTTATAPPATPSPATTYTFARPAACSSSPRAGFPSFRPLRWMRIPSTSRSAS